MNRVAPLLMMLALLAVAALVGWFLPDAIAYMW